MAEFPPDNDERERGPIMVTVYIPTAGGAIYSLAHSACDVSKRSVAPIICSIIIGLHPLVPTSKFCWKSSAVASILMAVNITPVTSRDVTFEQLCIMM